MKLFWTITSAQGRYRAKVEDDDTGYEVSAKVFDDEQDAEEWAETTLRATDATEWAETVLHLNRLNHEA